MVKANGSRIYKLVVNSFVSYFRSQNQSRCVTVQWANLSLKKLANVLCSKCGEFDVILCMVHV